MERDAIGLSCRGGKAYLKTGCKALNTSTRYKKDHTGSLAEFSDAALPSSSGL
jgi:hypothetical protein